MADESKITPEGEEVKKGDGSPEAGSPTPAASPDDGGPAFPLPIPSVPAGHYAVYESAPGMSLRDYFAAAALPAMLEQARESDYAGFEEACEWAYCAADLMLAERAKKGGEA